MKTPFIVLLLFVANCFGQKSFLEIDLKDISIRNIKDAYLIVDNQTNTYYTILEEDKITYGIKLDSDKKLKKIITSEGLKRKYKEIIGHVVKDDQVLLIQKNTKGNKLAYIKYDFTNGITSEVEYDAQQSTDRFIESYVTQDKCIIYTINTSNRILKKWEYKIDGTFTVKEINLDGQFRDLASDIIQANGFSTTIDLVKVNNKIPNNIEISSNENKMYANENNFIWTFDSNLKHTILVHFNAPNYEPTIQIIKKPTLKKGKSNSFLFEDKIAQVVSSNEELIVDIKQVATPEKSIKTFIVNKEDTINFKNSPILQEGSAYSFGNVRKMEKTSKLLRKMSSQNNGISIYKNKNNYHVTIGGKRIQASGPMMMGPNFGLIGGFAGGVITASFNPTFHAYGAYSSTGSTRIECLFDENFNHVKGEIDKNVFDRIDDFKEQNKIAVESITYINNKVIFGYLDKETNKYLFKEFYL